MLLSTSDKAELFDRLVEAVDEHKIMVFVNPECGDFRDWKVNDGDALIRTLRNCEYDA